MLLEGVEYCQSGEPPGIVLAQGHHREAVRDVLVTSYAEILLGDLAANDARRADVAQIQKAATGAATLTAQLLAFSRQRAITPRLVALEVLVAGSAKMLQQLLGEDIELVTTLSQEPLTVTIDPGQLEQIITNLAVNARDAMPRGGRVVIETARVDLGEESVPAHPPMSQGQYAMLAMSDTGVGMDQQTRARIFEPFFRTKEVDKGTGLGLATVYSIVKQNGGLVWVHSEPGHGATFKIYLPLSGQSAATAQLNGRPRQTLGWQTPSEAFASVVAFTA